MNDIQNYLDKLNSFSKLHTSLVSKPRVAVLICGLTRKYKLGAKSIKSLFDPNEVDVDYYLTTWDINGDYKYEKKDFTDTLSNNWIKSNQRLSEEAIQEIENLYTSQHFNILDYSGWESNIAMTFQEFTRKYGVEDEQLRIYNGIFAQYYQVKKAFEEVTKANKHYDLVIRTRYDLEVIDSSKFNILEMIDLVKDGNIVALETWDRYGIKGNWVCGKYNEMMKYSKLYDHMVSFVYTEDQMNEIKLASIHVPKFIFNYILGDKALMNKSSDEMNNQEIHGIAYEALVQHMRDFISDYKNLTYHNSIIPEYILKHFINKTCGINVKIYNKLVVKIHSD
jgi:SAM-dependent methyltransferase